jgi:EmrB/QacA subfamily drug resistance transporter
MAQDAPDQDIEAQEEKAQRTGWGRRVPILIGIMLGMLLAALDQTVVGTAMPHVIAELGGQAQTIAWVATAYLLASTVAVPIYGKLSDIYGRRIFFMGGMILFLIGSALSGASQDMTQLIAFRAIQGLGAGAIMPIALAIIADIFPPVERGKWQGLFMAVFGLATILGPFLGGWLTDNGPVINGLITATSRWRWVFYVNLPVGILALITAGFTIPGIVSHRKHHIDYLGSAALIAWSVPLLLALTWGGNQYAWGSWQIIALFAFAAVMLLAFIVRELTAAEPIISPRLFRSSIFSVSTLAMFLVSAGMFGAIYFLPYFTQYVLGDTATNSGEILTPMMLGFMVSSIIGGQILSRTGRYKILALVGFVVAIIGMVLLARMNLSTTNDNLIINMIVTGLGMGVMMSLFTIVVQNAFPVEKIGQVTATLTFFRSMGSTIGLAVFGAVFTNALTANMKANLPAALKSLIPVDKLTNIGQTQGGSGDLKATFAHFGPQGMVLYEQLMHAIKLSFASSIGEVFLMGAAMMTLAFVATLFLKEIPLRKSNKSVEGEPAPMEIGL